MPSVVPAVALLAAVMLFPWVALAQPAGPPESGPGRDPAVGGGRPRHEGDRLDGFPKAERPSQSLWKLSA